MKIAYTISGLYNSGGMENILLQKANYLAEVYGHEITIITTDQENNDIFFKISPQVRVIDLNINYNKTIRSRLWYVKKFNLVRRHKRRLADILHTEKFDVCISLMDFDFEFLTSINDGSKKIAEYHFSRYAKALSTRNVIGKTLQRLRTCQWKSILKKFDRFIVLTEQDKNQWGNMSNIDVIPNFINYFPEESCVPDARKIMSVGRMEYQKGFDMLLEAWEIVAKQLPDWSLSIYGGGDRSSLEQMIKDRMLERVSLNPPVSPIGKVYSECSLYVMSSRYEGLPLVLLEAMSYGLPIVSYECPCGPRDILRPDFGRLVKPDDVKALADTIVATAKDAEWRHKAVEAAKSHSHLFSKEVIMEKWNNLFSSLEII